MWISLNYLTSSIGHLQKGTGSAKCLSSLDEDPASHPQQSPCSYKCRQVVPSGLVLPDPYYWKVSEP